MTFLRLLPWLLLLKRALAQDCNPTGESLQRKPSRLIFFALSRDYLIADTRLITASPALIMYRLTKELNRQTPSDLNATLFPLPSQSTAS